MGAGWICGCEDRCAGDERTRVTNVNWTMLLTGNPTPILSREPGEDGSPEFERLWSRPSMLSLPDVTSFQPLSNVIRKWNRGDCGRIELHSGYGAVAHPVWYGKIGMDFSR